MLEPGVQYRYQPLPRRSRQIRLGMLGLRTNCQLRRKTHVRRAYLLSEVVEHWNISPSNHIFTLETSNLLELGLLLGVWLLTPGILLVDCAKQFLEQNEVLTFFKIVNFDVSEVGIDTQCQVGSKSVWCRCPGEQGSGWVVNEWERDSD